MVRLGAQSTLLDPLQSPLDSGPCVCVCVHEHVHVLLSIGTKYKFAQQWQIHCVSPQWFHDSVERGYCQSEEGYAVGGGGQGKRGDKGKGAAFVCYTLQHLLCFRLLIVMSQLLVGGSIKGKGSICYVQFCPPFPLYMYNQL